ncbi:hypothetical protein PQ469_05955 [Mucilaginibacter sp. KACC 22773]|uniref:hypothetical protein n=1 Tax=Mucilaginibacter sp. KACC 22773 TaxID=3025671 RepID=UPI0023673BA3|nr:hypothetical protein [Mucilaginibacter sp. KACC 22773]WDF79546.1 hypothetical protein PQ469_05955 [Mucilaginibacter sp. KACC 22773]
MQNLQLYIDDQLADLPDEPLQFSWQVNNLADVQNQNGSFSKQFKLPYSQNNKAILGFPQVIQLKSRAPYRRYSVKLIVNGIEVLPAGFGELQASNNDGFDFIILSGNTDFFESIGGNIYDMGDSSSVWTDYGKSLVWDQYSMPYPETPLHPDNCIFDLSHVANSQEKTEGWIWPVVDYGHVDLADFSKWINVRQCRPGFFLHSAIDLLIESTGYTVDTERSTLIRDPMYNKMIVQFANDSFEHGADYQNAPDNLGMYAIMAANTSASHTSISDTYGKGVFSFANIQSDPSHQFNGQYFTAKQRMSAVVTVVIPKLYFKGKVSSPMSNIKLQVKYHSVAGDQLDIAEQLYDLTDFNNREGDGGHLFGDYVFAKKTLSGTVELQPGDRINLAWEFFDSRPESFICYAGASLMIKTDTVNVLYSQPIQCERILPDISQKDFLKDTLQRFGIICQTDNIKKTIALFSMRDIVANIPKALNWTSKILDQGFQATYVLGTGYSRINWMRFQDDPDIPREILPKYFADDKIIIDSDVINPSNPQTDIITSIYGPSPNRPYYGGTIAQILKIDTTSSLTDFSITTKPRILIDQKLDLRKIGGKTVVFADGDQDQPGTNTISVNGIISTPYFWKHDGEFNPVFCDKEGQPGIRTKYYPEVERILQNTQKIVRYALLTPRDISGLDFTIPIYLEQDSCYYYLNKVDSWSPGNPCKIELVALA